MKRFINISLVLSILLSVVIYAQDEDKKDSTLSEVVSGLKWRSIGPAFTSGRIADFAS